MIYKVIHIQSWRVCMNSFGNDILNPPKVQYAKEPKAVQTRRIGIHNDTT